MQHTRDTLKKAAVEAVEAGVSGIMLFGVPEEAKKDALGTRRVPIRTGFCRSPSVMCGPRSGTSCSSCPTCVSTRPPITGTAGCWTREGRVDNDATLERYAEMAQVQADAGAHVVGPSGMMDGQIGVVRDALDQIGREDVADPRLHRQVLLRLLRALPGGRRFLAKGDRKTYQQDPANARESLRELALDLEEGADMVMVKPAGPYLDILARVADAVDVPVAAYQISGEYSMIEAAAEKGWIDRERAILETLTGIKRAGAQNILTYWATEAARML